MSNPLFGTCSNCGPNPSPGWTCTGSTQLGSTSAYADLDFGSQSAGKYQVQYCGGAWIFDTTGRPDKWTVDNMVWDRNNIYDTSQRSFLVIFSPQQTTQSSSDGTNVYLTIPGHGLTTGQPIVIYSSPAGTYDLTTTTSAQKVNWTYIDTDHISFVPPSGSATPQALLTDTSMTVWNCSDISQPSPTSTDEWAYTSQALAEAAFLCAGASIYHRGGHIKILYRGETQSSYLYGSAYTAFADGSPNPIFGLYAVLPEVQFNTACADWTTKGSAAEVSVSVNNLNGVTWNNVTATLINAAGISGSAMTIPGNPFGLNPGINSLAFVFNTTTALVPGVVELTSPEWTGTITIPWYMGPIYTAVSVGAPASGGTCTGGSTIREFPIALQNDGYWKTDPQVVFTFTPLVGGGPPHVFFTTFGCATSSSQTATMDLVPCQSIGGGSSSYTLLLSDGTTTGQGTLTMVVSDAGAALGTFTASVTVAH